MSQGKLNGSSTAATSTTGQTPQQPNLGAQIAQQGMSPTPVQSTIGLFGNSFGQPGPVGTPGGFGSGQGGSAGRQAAWSNLQSTIQQGNQMFGATGSPVAPQAPGAYISGLGQGAGTTVGPVMPNDDGLQADGQSGFNL